MNSTIIKIGNSKGIRIPKVLLAESGITELVNIVVKKGEIVIRPISDTVALSENSLSDWLRPEENIAWKDLR